MSQAMQSKLIKSLLSTENYFLISDVLCIFYLINKIHFRLTGTMHPKKVLGCINTLDKSEVSVAKTCKSIILKPFLTMV